MDLDKLFGSKTKVDIMKYLLFKRQGVSMRALEGDLTWTFPAIKKQIDALEKASIITVDKSNLKRSIVLHSGFGLYIRNIITYAIVFEINQYLGSFGTDISKVFYGKIFGSTLDMDLVIIYTLEDKKKLLEIKNTISDIFKGYFIDQVALTTMSQKERDQRYRLADKFVLTIMREKKEFTF